MRLEAEMIKSSSATPRLIRYLVPRSSYLVSSRYASTGTRRRARRGRGATIVRGAAGLLLVDRRDVAGQRLHILFRLIVTPWG